MAAGDFEERVEALTGIAIESSGSDPTQAELTQFLVDGVHDVVNRMIIVKPAELPRFCTTTDSGAGTTVTKTGQILSVMREHDSISILRPCARISPNDRYEATDTDSLRFRSKTNPGYYELNAVIHTIPVAAESGNNNVVVTQIAYDTGLVFGDAVGSIANFPTEYEYLVTLYASIQSLQAALAAKSAPSVPISQVLPALNITATDPTAISLTTVNYNPVIASTSTAVASLTAPTYSKPTLVLGTAPTISNLSITAVPPDTPSAPSFTGALVLAVTSRAVSTSAPDYDRTIADTAIALATATIVEANTYIDTNEDVELASSKLSEVQATINEANLRIQNELNEFNQENIAYQQDVQEALAEMQVAAAKAQKDADITQQTEIQEYASKIQRYQTELGVYQAEVGSQVQEYQQNLAGDIQVWQGERATDLQKYSTDIQNELNEFNKENVSFGYEVQKALADAQVTNQVALQNGSQEARDAIENNNAQVARFQSMAQHYSAQVSEDVQKYTVQVQGLAADIQASVAEHTAELQGTQAEYQWLQDQYTRLKAEYDQVFMIAAPQQQVAPEAARQRR